MLVQEGGRLEARHVVLAVDKDGTLLVRHGLAASDKVVAKPKPEAKTGDIVSIDGAAPTAAPAAAPAASAASAAGTKP